ncbi:hypothetical protein ACQKWADRAFT_312424 [Trichoderma austrokoningii]
MSRSPNQTTMAQLRVCGITHEAVSLATKEPAKARVSIASVWRALVPPYRRGYLDNVPICEPLIGRSSTSIDASQHISHAGSTTLWAFYLDADRHPGQ